LPRSIYSILQAMNRIIVLASLHRSDPGGAERAEQNMRCGNERSTASGFQVLHHQEWHDL
jgi:hypothetical protein